MEVKFDVLQTVGMLRWYGPFQKMNEERLPNILIDWRLNRSEKEGQTKDDLENYD